MLKEHGEREIAAHHPLDGVDDAHIAGAAAQVAAHLGADLGPRQAALAAHQVARGDQHAGGAIPALQGVRFGEGLTQAGHRRVIVEALDGAHAGAVAGHRKGDAGAGDLAVDLHSAGAADAVLAADVRAGEQEVLAQEVGQVRAWGHVGLDRLAVDGESDAGHAASTCAMARRTATACSLRS